MKNDATHALVEGTNVLSREEFEALRSDQKSGVRSLLREIIIESGITDDAEIDRYLSTALSQTHIVVRVSGGEIVSVCTLRSPNRVETTLGYLGTDERHRRQGHAREMLKDAIDFLIREQLACMLKANGYTDLSRDLFTQLGFTADEYPTLFLSRMGGVRMDALGWMEEPLTYEITERHLTDDWEGLLSNAIDLILDQWQTKGFHGPQYRDKAHTFLEQAIATDGAKVTMFYRKGNDDYEVLEVDFGKPSGTGAQRKPARFHVARDTKVAGKINSTGLMRHSQDILSDGLDRLVDWRVFHYN